MSGESGSVTPLHAEPIEATRTVADQRGREYKFTMREGDPCVHIEVPLIIVQDGKGIDVHKLNLAIGELMFLTGNGPDPAEINE